jgi:hypothetical protein
MLYPRGSSGDLAPTFASLVIAGVGSGVVIVLDAEVNHAMNECPNN